MPFRVIQGRIRRAFASDAISARLPDTVPQDNIKQKKPADPVTVQRAVQLKLPVKRDGAEAIRILVDRQFWPMVFLKEFQEFL